MLRAHGRYQSVSCLLHHSLKSRVRSARIRVQTIAHGQQGTKRNQRKSLKGWWPGSKANQRHSDFQSAGLKPRIEAPDPEEHCPNAMRLRGSLAQRNSRRTFRQCGHLENRIVGRTGREILASRPGAASNPLAAAATVLEKARMDEVSAATPTTVYLNCHATSHARIAQ